jgi:hypothetical protein
MNFMFPIRRLQLFYVPLKNLHSYGNFTIASEGLQILALLSVLMVFMTFEQGGIFIVPHLL